MQLLVLSLKDKTDFQNSFLRTSNGSTLKFFTALLSLNIVLQHTFISLSDCNKNGGVQHLQQSKLPACMGKESLLLHFPALFHFGFYRHQCSLFSNKKKY